MNFKTIIEFGAIILIALLIITGLSFFKVSDNVSEKWDKTFKSGLEEQDDVAYIDNAYDVAWNEIEKKANETHEPMSLDPDFLERHFDVETMSDLEELVQSGMEAVIENMEEGTDEYNLMKAMINTNEISYITSDDLNKTYQEFDAALTRLAEEKNISKTDYLNSYYNMSDEDFKKLVEKKTADMHDANVKALEQIKEREKNNTQQVNAQGDTTTQENTNQSNTENQNDQSNQNSQNNSNTQTTNEINTTGTNTQTQSTENNNSENERDVEEGENNQLNQSIVQIESPSSQTEQ